jgi:uncharacterized OB-fold protein
MRDFFYYLNMGELRIPTCKNCQNRVWPPKSFCSICLSDNISFGTTCVKGRILELSKSYEDGMPNGNVFALIEISGIRLIGSVAGSRISKENSVILQRCGLRKDKEPFYEFRVVKEP